MQTTTRHGPARLRTTFAEALASAVLTVVAVTALHRLALTVVSSAPRPRLFRTTFEHLLRN